MDGYGYGYGSGQRGDRRLEIVSGKGFGFGNSNQIFATRPHSPNVASIPPRRSLSSSSKPWGGLTDPEMKRKKRIAKYKVYTVEVGITGGSDSYTSDALSCLVVPDGDVAGSVVAGNCWIDEQTIMETIDH
ncbi:hypothetical protein POTOM_046891 [Populus tomentosa]|uniref:Uncharacterized protein n=1 Tax=Populus tomentosa TaxID=118781 RepID=A0A8X7YFM4_POPTO|nr:hypothetical protein POTOM_046891 [Populus tomentosa]